DGRELGGHHVHKTFLASFRAGGADLIAEHHGFALPVEQLAEVFGGNLAAFEVVGGDVADGFVRVESGVDDDDRDFGAQRGFDGSDQGLRIQRREDDSVGTADGEVFDDGDLLIA